ncbi:MAG TPA: lysylphosphatidylglycerol synthase transmembrane domain-containing protein [Candidatus Acidoferrales bacterium]|nr:lysylphosphatidylglycerol synthase transmembrane domain-containing protein [Candidatus Acidoferrales bacterium]
MSRTLRRYLLLLLALCVIGYFLYRSRNSVTLKVFRWSMVARSLGDARISLLLLALAAIYVCYAIRALRWMQFSRTLGKLHFWNVYSAQLMGFACLFIFGRAGEPVRPVLVARKDSLSVPRMFGVYVLERVFDIASTVVLAGFALLLFERRGLIGEDEATFMDRARATGVALLILLVILISVLVYFRYHGGAWLSRKLQHESWRQSWRAKAATLLEGFSEGLQGIRTWGDLGILIGYTAVHWLLVALIYLWVSHAFGGDFLEVGYPGAVLVLAFTMVGSTVQLPAVGGGAQAATFLVFTQIFNVDQEPAAVASIMLWLITFAGVCIVGVPLLLREGWSFGDLRRMAAAEAEAKRELLEGAEQAADSSKRVPKEKLR